MLICRGLKSKVVCVDSWKRGGHRLMVGKISQKGIEIRVRGRASVDQLKFLGGSCQEKLDDFEGGRSNPTELRKKVPGAFPVGDQRSLFEKQRENLFLAHP